MISRFREGNREIENAKTNGEVNSGKEIEKVEIRKRRSSKKCDGGWGWEVSIGRRGSASVGGTCLLKYEEGLKRIQHLGSDSLKGKGGVAILKG